MTVQPFTISVPETTLDDLRARLARTRWLDAAEESSWNYGISLEYMKELADHWQHNYDWRKHEATLNKYSQYITEIDGQTIHFMHVRSSNTNAIPLLICHGYPSSFAEFLHMINPLVNPDAGEQAFHVIIPSLPGFDFSTP